MQRATRKVRTPKFTCEYCGLQYEAETYLMFRHMQTEHPDIWAEIQTQETRRLKIKGRAQLEDEQSIACPRCGGGGKLFINEKGQERTPGEDYHE